MAGRENIGGFYYSLGIDTDKGAFARASDAINGMVNLVKTAALAIGAGFAIKATVQNASEVYTLASRMEEGVQTLRDWEAASNILGANFKGITTEITGLDEKMRRITRGQFDATLGTSVAQFGLDFDTFRNMDEIERATTVIERAIDLVKTGKQSAADVRTYVKDILGASSADLFDRMLTENAKKLGLDTVSGMLAYADAHIFNTESATEALDMLGKETSTLRESFSSLWTLILGDMATEWLNPALDGINTWIGNNKETIQKGIDEAFKVAGEVTDKIIDFFKSDTWAGIWETMQDAWEIAKESAKWIWEHTIGYKPDAIELSDKEAMAMRNEFSRTYGNGPDAAAKAAADLFKSPDFAQATIDMLKQAIPADLVNDIITEYNLLVDGAPKQKAGGARLLNKLLHGKVSYLNDGIISPGGGITQVAPNDWVLAFKNLGDVAGAFHQGGQAGGVANVTISQTFNVNGNPMPGAVREQAYRGTTSAMSEAFTRAGMIVQMMPGTR